MSQRDVNTRQSGAIAKRIVQITNILLPPDYGHSDTIDAMKGRLRTPGSSISTRLRTAAAASQAIIELLMKIRSVKRFCYFS